METVNFKCGHCGNLMGVGAEHLGQQVRCPHCQQVVLAPADAASGFEPTLSNLPAMPPPPPDETALLPPPDDDAASIFTEDGPLDPLFDDPKPPPLDLSLPVPPLDSTLAYPAGPASKLAETPPSGSDLPDWMTPPAPAATPSANGSAPDLPAPPLQAPRRSSRGLMLFLTLVFMPLVLYSILATIVAILALSGHSGSRDKGDPREFLNDVEGDHPGATKTKAVSYVRQTDVKQATAALPDHLRIKLGDTLDLDQLHVTPERVELGTVKMTVAGGGKPEPRRVFLLRLHLENVSKDTAFYPLDAYFDRQSDGKTVPVPFDVLLAGEQLRFFGGPAHWSRRGPVSRSDHATVRYDVVGAGGGTELKPGATMDAFVCTDGFDPERDSPLEAKFHELLSYPGKLVWHVQVRRGLTHWKDRDYPTTTVFGVEFTAADVQRPE